MLPEQFWQGIEAFNQEEFYACHDILEAIWLESAELNRNFYQGILQIAVACYHLNHQNWQGAVTLLGEGIRRLHSYSPDWEGVNIDQLLDDSHQLLEELQKCGIEGFSEFQASAMPKVNLLSQ